MSLCEILSGSVGLLSHHLCGAGSLESFNYFYCQQESVSRLSWMRTAREINPSRLSARLAVIN